MYAFGPARPRARGAGPTRHSIGRDVNLVMGRLARPGTVDPSGANGRRHVAMLYHESD